MFIKAGYVHFSMDEQTHQLIRELWKQFTPGNEQNQKFESIREKLEKESGFVSAYLDTIPNYLEEQDPNFLRLFGHYHTGNSGIFSDLKQASKARVIQCHTLMNVAHPTDKNGYFIESAIKGGRKYRAFRLAREISKDNVTGLEFIVFDKGCGFIGRDG